MAPPDVRQAWNSSVAGFAWPQVWPASLTPGRKKVRGAAAERAEVDHDPGRRGEGPCRPVRELRVADDLTARVDARRGAHAAAERPEVDGRGGDDVGGDPRSDRPQADA